MIDKIFIVSIDNDKIENIKKRIASIDDTIKIASMFTTDSSYIDSESYISNDELYLAYKNNAILCTKTISNEVSIGYTKDEFDTSDIICMPYDLYCNMSQKQIKDILIVWIDNTVLHKDKNILNSAKEFIELTKNRNLLYFNSSDLDDLIISNMLNYVSGTKEEKERIKIECN